MRCDMLDCSIGTVLDLSALGMRVSHRGYFRASRGDVLQAKIACLDGLLWVKVRVCWIKKTGFMRRIIGVEFVDLDDTAVRVIQQVAQFAGVRHVLPSSSLS